MEVSASIGLRGAAKVLEAGATEGLRVTRLRRVSCSDPGIRRVRRGKGFSYEDDQGRPIEDPPTLERIRGLAIPPAWADVWICAHERGHLQAVGTDGAGRRQYLYHSAWRTRRDVEKFRRVERFAERLPRLRRRVARDLRRSGMPRERALATAIRLLDQGSFRIGSEDYAARNGSFGLATLRRSHVEIQGDVALFDYEAKGGVRRIHAVEDSLVLEPLRWLVNRNGGSRELLAYREDGRWRDIRSSDINGYLKTIAGEEYSAKDFRTWHATVQAAIVVAGAARDGASVRRTISATVRCVAEHLGNTPAVCRASYIDPRVFDRFREGLTIHPRWASARTFGPRSQARVEREVLALLADEREISRAA
jgi:DNA topoisomerase IB